MDRQFLQLFVVRLLSPPAPDLPWLCFLPSPSSRVEVKFKRNRFPVLFCHRCNFRNVSEIGNSDSRGGLQKLCTPTEKCGEGEGWLFAAFSCSLSV
jgi:hypothetical protein